MQTLYGIKITDRVTVEFDLSGGSYKAYFDGEPVPGEFSHGCIAVNAAIDFIRQKREEREAAEAAEAARAEREQASEDQRFLWDLASTLGIGDSDMDTLIEIIVRRAKS